MTSHCSACIALWLWWTISQIASGGYDKACSVIDQRASGAPGLCGKELSSVLSLVCGFKGYYGNPKGKRDTTLLSDTPLVKPRDGHFLTKRQALSVLFKRSDHSGHPSHFYTGIVCECCYNQCSIYELSQYCNGPSKRRITGSIVPDNDDNVPHERRHSRRRFESATPRRMVAARQPEKSRESGLSLSPELRSIWRDLLVDGD